VLGPNWNTRLFETAIVTQMKCIRHYPMVLQIMGKQWKVSKKAGQCVLGILADSRWERLNRRQVNHLNLNSMEIGSQNRIDQTEYVLGEFQYFWHVFSSSRAPTPPIFLMSNLVFRQLNCVAYEGRYPAKRWTIFCYMKKIAGSQIRVSLLVRFTARGGRQRAGVLFSCRYLVSL